MQHSVRKYHREKNGGGQVNPFMHQILKIAGGKKSMASSYRCGYHALGSATSPHVKTGREFPYPSPCEVARRDRVRAWPDARLIVTLRPQGGFQLGRFKMPFLPVNTMTTAVPWVLTAGRGGCVFCTFELLQSQGALCYYRHWKVPFNHHHRFW